MEVHIMSEIPKPKIIDKMETILNIASDSTRLKILYSIQDESKSVNDIVKACDASQSLISHQLAILKKAHLVTSEKVGKKVYYKLDDDHVVKLLQLVYEHVIEDK